MQFLVVQLDTSPGFNNANFVVEVVFHLIYVKIDFFPTMPQAFDHDHILAQRKWMMPSFRIDSRKINPF